MIRRNASASRPRQSMTRLRTEELGAEAVEFAIILPLLIVLSLGMFPLLDFIVASRDVARVADETVLLATRVSSNPARTSDDSSCGGLTRRRSYAQVSDFATAADPRISSVDVYVQDVGAPEPDMAGPSTANPCTAPVSSRIHVRLQAQYTTGPVAPTVNAVARMLGISGNIVPESATLTATAAGYLE